MLVVVTELVFIPSATLLVVQPDTAKGEAAMHNSIGIFQILAFKSTLSQQPATIPLSARSIREFRAKKWRMLPQSISNTARRWRELVNNRHISAPQATRPVTTFAAKTVLKQAKNDAKAGDIDQNTGDFDAMKIVNHKRNKF